MSNIKDILSKPLMLDYLKTRTYPPFIGQTLFPETKKPNMRFEYIKGARNVPVIAHVHAFGTEAELGHREGFGKVSLKALLIKRKIGLDEEIIIELSNPRTDAEFQYLKNEVFNDVDNMVSAVRARIEKMRMDVLSTGLMPVDENGLSFTIDFLVPEANKPVLTGTDLWSSDDSDPIEDMTAWTEIIRDTTGDVLTRTLTSGKVLSRLLRHPKIRSAMFGVNSAMMPTKAQLNAFLEQQGLPKIAVNDAKYRDFDKYDGDGNPLYKTERYFAENKFVMMPDGTMGETLFAPTAEETRLIKDPGIDIRKIGNIIADIYETDEPVGHWTKAVAIAAPSFPLADSVIQATVLA